MNLSLVTRIQLSDWLILRSASVEAYSELERKRTSSGSINYGSDSGEEMGRSGVVPDNQQYVCENVFGNLSLQASFLHLLFFDDLRQV